MKAMLSRCRRVGRCSAGAGGKGNSDRFQSLSGPLCCCESGEQDCLALNSQLDSNGTEASVTQPTITSLEGGASHGALNDFLAGLMEAEDGAEQSSTLGKCHEIAMELP